MNTTDNKQAGAVGYIRDDGIQELNGGRLNLALWAEPSFGVKTPVYLAPPAAVPVEALDKLKQLADRMVCSLASYDEGLSEHYRAQLTTLIKERSNAN